MTTLKKNLVSHPKFPNVVDMLDNTERKIVLFDEQSLQEESPVQVFIRENQLVAEQQEVELTFDNLNS